MVLAVVFGGGVVGLCSAIRLLEDGWEVLLVAHEVGYNTTSAGTCAFWEPFLANPEDRVRYWAKEALKDFKELMKNEPSTGIWECSGWDFSQEAEYNVPQWMRELVPWRLATPEEIPQGFSSGVHYTTLIIPMNHFIPWLLQRFHHLGGIIERRLVTDFHSEIVGHPSQPDLVVNCCGLSAHHLLKDEEVFPVRGQVVKVEAPHVKTFHLANEKDFIIYILPRKDCVVLGGSAVKGSWDTTVDPKETQRILQQCERLYPGISKAKIIQEWVGLRPGRSEIRLEEETVKVGAKEVTVLHNYGHGGGGVTLSWGCAREVQQLARKKRTRSNL